MRSQVIIKIVDASVNQHRYIIWLKCGHTASINADLVNGCWVYNGVALAVLEHSKTTNRYVCMFCPNLTPPEIREAKSAHRLWREAGEP